MTRVSVVMPVYNAAPTVTRAIGSILAQTRPVDEIIVVDDGSVDASADVVRRIGDSRITFFRQDNGGAASARNAGIARASGDLIALLDADDWWAPSKLSRQIEVFEQHPEVVATASNWGWLDAESGPAGFSLPASQRGRVLRATRRDVFRFAFAMTSSTVVARGALLKRHRFDESLQTAEDRDVWIRLVLEGDVWFDDAVLATITGRDDSLSNSDVDRDCASMLRVLGRYAHLVDKQEVRRWEARTYARWVGRLLGAGRPVEALGHATQRWRREYTNPRAWLALCKCWWHAKGAGRAPGSR